VGRVTDPYVAGFLGAFLTAAIPEEFFKLVIVRGYCARHRDFTESIDGVVYGVVASLGFATMENVLYVAAAGFVAALPRAFTAVPGHAFMGAIMGYYVGRAKFHPNERVPAQILAYLVPMTLHGIYDFPIFTLLEFQERTLPVSDGVFLLPLSLAAFVTLWIWAVRCMRDSRADQEAAGPSSMGELAPGAAARVSGVRHDRFWVSGTVLLLLGLVLATGGAIVLLHLTTAMLSGTAHVQEEVFVGIVPVGAVTFPLGLALFGLGIRSLNRTG
jgi:hypothetical protein